MRNIETIHLIRIIGVIDIIVGALLMVRPILNMKSFTDILQIWPGVLIIILGIAICRYKKPWG